MIVHMKPSRPTKQGLLCRFNEVRQVRWFCAPAGQAGRKPPFVLNVMRKDGLVERASGVRHTDAMRDG